VVILFRFLRPPLPPISTLFPYTTLFRSVLSNTYEQLVSSGTHTFRNFLLFRGAVTGDLFRQQWLSAGVPADQIEGLTLPDARKRSEEHTSELQSLAYLVCRLLLEKKKKK